MNRQACLPLSCGLRLSAGGSVVVLFALGWGEHAGAPWRRRWLYQSTQPAVACSMSAMVL